MSPVTVDPWHIEVLPCIQDPDPDRHIAIDPGSVVSHIYTSHIFNLYFFLHVSKEQHTQSLLFIVPLGNSGT